MKVTIIRLLSLLTVLVTATPAILQAQAPAQTPTSRAPQAPVNQRPRIQNPGNSGAVKPPDMVCFGYWPNWSVEFVNGEARYVGVNEPDQYFDGEFYWVPEDQTWQWHQESAANSRKPGYGLTANIQKAACNDPVRKSSFPYSAQVYLPQGDMVSGCCRKLTPGEAPVGRHGAPAGVTGTAPALAKPAQPGTPQGH